MNTNPHVGTRPEVLFSRLIQQVKDAQQCESNRIYLFPLECLLDDGVQRWDDAPRRPQISGVVGSASAADEGSWWIRAECFTAPAGHTVRRLIVEPDTSERLPFATLDYLGAASRVYPLQLRPLNDEQPSRSLRTLVRLLNPPTIDQSIAWPAFSQSMPDALGAVVWALSLRDDVKAHVLTAGVAWSDELEHALASFCTAVLVAAPMHTALCVHQLNCSSDSPAVDAAIERIEQELSIALAKLDSLIRASFPSDRAGAQAPWAAMRLDFDGDVRVGTVRMSYGRDTTSGGRLIVGHPLWSTALVSEGLGVHFARVPQMLTSGALSAERLCGAMTGRAASPEAQSHSPGPSAAHMGDLGEARQSSPARSKASGGARVPEQARQAAERAVDPAALAVLRRGTFDGQTYRLPQEQLERALYESVAAEIKSLGGKWNRSAQGFVFAHADDAGRLRDTLDSGTLLDPKDLAFFPTPEGVAKRLVRLARLQPGTRVLEPSCGALALAEAAADVVGRHNVVCVDLNPIFVQRARDAGFEAHQADFLALRPDAFNEQFDLVLMNPPFTRGADMEHVLHAAQFGQTVACIVSRHYQSASSARAQDFRSGVQVAQLGHIDMPPGTFAQSGTKVGTRMLVLDAVALRRHCGVDDAQDQHEAVSRERVAAA